MAVQILGRDGASLQIVNTDGSVPVGVGSSQASTSNPLPMQQVATYFKYSANNSTTVQLAGGAIFTGVIESVVDQQMLSLLINSDQAGLLTLNEYIDSGGTYLIGNRSYTVAASSDLNMVTQLNGNYFNLTWKNTGVNATTTLNINSYYGTMPPMGQQKMAYSMPVTIASDQSSIPVTATLTLTTLPAGSNTIGYVMDGDGAQPTPAMPQLKLMQRQNLILAQLMYAQATTANGFVPLEIPEFLIGG